MTTRQATLLVNEMDKKSSTLKHGWSKLKEYQEMHLSLHGVSFVFAVFTTLRVFRVFVVCLACSVLEVFVLYHLCQVNMFSGREAEIAKAVATVSTASDSTASKDQGAASRDQGVRALNQTWS